MTEGNERQEHDIGGVANAIEPLSREERRVWELERFDELPRCIGMETAAEFLGISKSACYERRKDGTIRARQVGGRWIIPRYELFRLIFSPAQGTEVRS